MAVQRRELTINEICAITDRGIITTGEARDLLGVGNPEPVMVCAIARQLREALASQSRWCDPAFTRELDRLAR